MQETTLFFATYKSLFVVLHVFAVIFGMGAALVSDVLFNVFIKDFKINPTENTVLAILSKIIWLSLGVMVLSGVALFLSDPHKYMYSVKFLTKMTIVGCIIVNGLLFQKLIHPSLRKMDFRDQNGKHKTVQIRRLSFAMGSISAISWTLAFVLGMQEAIPFTYGEAVLTYASLCVLGIFFSQILERRVTRVS